MALITDDDFIDEFCENKIVVQKGFITHGMPKHAPVRFRRLDWGVLYILRNGFFSGASYSMVEFRIAPSYLLYSQVQLLHHVNAGIHSLESKIEMWAGFSSFVCEYCTHHRKDNLSKASTPG